MGITYTLLALRHRLNMSASALHPRLKNHPEKLLFLICWQSITKIWISPSFALTYIHREDKGELCCADMLKSYIARAKFTTLTIVSIVLIVYSFAMELLQTYVCAHHRKAFIVFNRCLNLHFNFLLSSVCWFSQSAAASLISFKPLLTTLVVCKVISLLITFVVELPLMNCKF